MKLFALQLKLRDIQYLELASLNCVLHAFIV
jgi:hypothetical protein